MSRFLKSAHLCALGLGFLAAAGVIFNLTIFSLLFPQVTQLLEQDPRWETYGIVAGINIIVIALFQLTSVLTLLADMIAQKRTSTLMILAVATGIISGLMILGDIALLSDIGKEYEMGWQTRGEWIVLFLSYGLHVVSLSLTLIALIRNLQQVPAPPQGAVKDEVLFLSLHTTGVISGALGLAGVSAGLVGELSLWIMERIVPILGLLVLSPFLVILGIWLFRQRLGEFAPGLDEKQFQDLAASGLYTLLSVLPLMVIFFGIQQADFARETWSALWLPLLIFLSLTIFSGLTLRYYQQNS